MKTYLESLQHILDNGETRTDRTGVGTLSVFGIQQRYDLSKSFPAVTTKKLAFKACLSELLWFIEGSTDERRLAEILHGTRDSEKKTIWTANSKDFGSNDLGPVYGKQWRQWETNRSVTFKDETVPLVIDQLQELIESIKTNPTSRRHILTAWNPGEIDQMALPPCHCFAQFYVSSDNKLSCQIYQRSCDMFLGVPFNIASYSLLTHMIAQVCDLEVGDLVHVLGDAHIYLNHLEQVKEQLQREPLPAPTLWINPDINNIDDFAMDDFKLENYNPLESINAPMAV